MSVRDALHARARQLIVLALLLALCVTLIAQNFEPVEMKLTFITARMPRFALPLAGAGVGFVFGWFVGRRRPRPATAPAPKTPPPPEPGPA